MFDEADRETGYAVFVAIALAIVVSLSVIAIAVGTAIGASGGAGASTTVAAPSLLRVVSVVLFDVDKADLPPDMAILIAPAIRAARASTTTRLVVSGYHDAGGDVAAGADLARRRALAVRDALIGAGIDEQRIEVAPPVVAAGGGDPREALRVEVTLR